MPPSNTACIARATPACAQCLQGGRLTAVKGAKADREARERLWHASLSDMEALNRPASHADCRDATTACEEQMWLLGLFECKLDLVRQRRADLVHADDVAISACL
jgi:hypothetical protein